MNDNEASCITSPAIFPQEHTPPVDTASYVHPDGAAVPENAAPAPDVRKRSADALLFGAFQNMQPMSVHLFRKYLRFPSDNTINSSAYFAAIFSPN